MRSYELVFIVSPKVTDEELPKVLDKITGLIANKGGNVTEVSQWGRRKLAYPIGQHLEGNYVLTRLELQPRAVKEIDANLHLSNEVIRHLLVRIPEGETS